MTLPAAEADRGAHPPQGYPPGMASVPHTALHTAEALAAALQCSAPMKHCRSLVPDRHCWHAVGHLQINTTLLISHAGTAADFLVEHNPNLHLVLCWQGGLQLRSDGGEARIGGGSVLLLPTGMRHSQGSHSLVSITITPQQVAATVAAMAGIPGVPASLGRSLAHGPMLRLEDSRRCAPIQALVRYIDLCQHQLPGLPARLGLEDTLHRLVASLLRPDLLSADPADLQRIRERFGKSSFDDLLDYIRANLDQPLRMSELEARSHYSRRALQYAFRERLGCTPKQWIRQQRLERAMAELCHDGPRSSVRQVALACGYRQSSHFSRDFQQQFGIRPSEVRRQAP
ncbi:MAG: AraC family transcriptional regulator [Synechococcaceae cyanobacterium]|nr:AraC family transcriptional regulator [Synechococcaceae cyanobacterium]